jgi:Na+/H+-dicarboxylate symporter
MIRKSIPLWKRVFLAMILGLITGFLLKEKAAPLAYLGIIFLNLIKMVIIPLIFCTIIYGITGIESNEGLSRMTYKAIIIFLFTATIAGLIGLATSSFLKPGLSDNNEKILAFLQKSHLASHLEPASLESFFLHIIPSNIFDAAAKGNILQIIVFAFFLGIILQKKRHHCEDLIKIFNQAAQLFFTMIEKIMKLSPLGVFGYMASLAGSDSLEVMTSLAKLVATITIASFIQYLVFGLIILMIGKISPLPFYKKILDIQLLAFSTSSSKAVLVPMINKSQKELGVSKEGSRFILPLAAALNMDGGAIYQVSSAIFFSQIYGLDLTFQHYLIIIFMSTIASIGGAGIPSGVLLFLGMVLTSIGLPMEGVLLVATVDRILDMITTMINVTGDLFATLLVEISEKRLDKKKYNS